MAEPLVGIIANPASGRDIRRLVAHGTVFDNNEKTAIVRRTLLGLEAAGIRRVAYMPEHDFGIVSRALDGQHLTLTAEPLAMPVLGTSSDSTRAARLLAELGARCIITLGGDGTNRAVAKGCASLPLVPISTGTNNVFPAMVEGTTAGMAAGFVARGCVDEGAVRRTPWLEVLVNSQPAEIALIDAVVSMLPFVGARAIWDLSTVREVVLSRVIAGTIGLSALGGALLDSPPQADRCKETPPGMHIVLGAGGREVMAALAPGLIAWVGIASCRPLFPGDVARFQSADQERGYTIALDGERELVLPSSAIAGVRLRADGPFVVDVPTALAGAARTGYLHRQKRTDASAETE